MGEATTLTPPAAFWYSRQNLTPVRPEASKDVGLAALIQGRFVSVITSLSRFI